MIRKFNKAALALMVLAGSAGMAHAAGQLGTIDTKSADVAFSMPSGVEHTLVAVDNLQPGGPTSSTTVVAHGTISTSDVALVAVRANPGTSVPIAGKTLNNFTIKGLNPSNSLGLYFVKTDFVEDGNPEGWYVTNTPVQTQLYEVHLQSKQNIVSDIYRVTMDAALWAN